MRGLEKVFEVEVKDEKALRIFKEHISTKDNLSEEEKRLVLEFLGSPLGLTKKLITKFPFATTYSSFKEMERIARGGLKKILTMVDEYLREEGWIRENPSGGECFLWEQIRNAEDLEKFLEKLKEKGEKDFLEIRATRELKFRLYSFELRLEIYFKEVSNVLKRRVDPGERLSPEEVLEVLREFKSY